MTRPLRLGHWALVLSSLSTQSIRREAWIAAGLALSIGLVYALTFQTRYYNDGPALTTMHLLATRTLHTHALYLPACDLLAGVFGRADPLLALRLASILPAASGCGCAFLVARRCGAPVFGAWVATVLLALSPALWFFGTTIEVHALFFGAVTFAALVTLLVPWRHPGLALALVALLFPVLYWAHESAFLLGPGWVLLVQYARARRGTRYSWPALLLQVGPVLLLALGLGIALASLARDGSVAAVVESTRVQLEVPGYQAALHGRSVLWNEWFLPLGLFVPLALSGSPLLRQEAWRLPSFAALLLVPLVFFSWWGVLEQGGYSLGSAGFLLVPVALLLGGWSRPRGVLALFLLAGQAAWARVRIESFDQGWVPAERVTQVRSALGDSGLLLSSVGLAPDIRIDLPGVEEFSLRHFVHSACLREHRLVPPQEIVASLAPHLLRLFERHERVALETGFHRLTVRDGPALSAFVPSLSAVEEFLREHYLTRELAHPYWGLLVLERPKGR